MAFSIRLPSDLYRKLDAVAAVEHVSKNTHLAQGRRPDRGTSRRREVNEGLDFVMSHDAELLVRLEDA